MKILLISVGTRGDIEPFLAIAEILNEHGHDVLCCFPEQFRSITEDSNFRFAGLSAKYLKMLESDDGKIAMGGKANFLRKIKAYYLLYKKASIVNKVLCSEQQQLISLEKPDKIIYHVKACYPLIYEAQNPGKTVLVSPIPYMVHSVKEHAHIGFNTMGAFWNKATYRLANLGLLRNVQSAANGLYDKKKLTSKKIMAALAKGKTVYSISPFLFQRPNYWTENVQIMGYHERNKTLKWKPEKELLDFIKTHEKILFVTFGSMVNAEPKKKTETIINVLEKLNIPAIINTGEGGLIKSGNYNTDLFHFVSNIPYDWLLPQVDYMVHHGGSGTTHMAMKYGCPSLIIPHIIDQFLWNKINAAKGLGPKGVPINKLSAENLQSLLIELTSKTSYKETATEAASEIKSENFKMSLYQFTIS